MIQFRLAELRKKKGMTQQELADMLSVSYQTISRWETGAVFPDVTVLPALSRIFKVSVDALLGLAPLDDDYERSLAGTGEYWEKRLDYMKRVRKTMWNEDYAAFLVERVWICRRI